MFRAVGNRCAVDFSELHLPMTNREAMTMLTSLNFQAIEVNLLKIARACIGASRYQRGSRLADAPDVLDCSSFIKWLYAQRGIWLPRRTVQQMEIGTPIDLSNIVAGDVIFTTGRVNYYLDDPAQGVGHAGFATGEGTVVHAANSRTGIVESKLDNFLGKCELRGVRRYLDNPADVLTLLTPPRREVETSDDIRWIILQRLPCSCSS